MKARICLHCGKPSSDHVRLVTKSGRWIAVCSTSIMKLGCPMCAREQCACKVSAPGTHPRL